MAALIGSVGGVIGAIGGIFGSMLGYLGYREAKSAKVDSLRVQSKMAENKLRSTVSDLPTLLERSKGSRTKVRAAQGRYQAGEMRNWLGEFEADNLVVAGLIEKLPVRIYDDTEDRQKALETKIISIHEVQLIADRLTKKYTDSLVADDKDREQIARAHTNR